jgi:ABC-type Fe3+/spermidine/putrescine transport system ATPase subunit
MVMSDRIALLRSGELEQVASPREIYSRPATAYTAQFIGHTNLLHADVHNGIVKTITGMLTWPASLPDGPALFSLRPECIRVVESGAPLSLPNSPTMISQTVHSPTTTTPTIRFQAKLRDQVFHGANELWRVECADGQILTLRTATRPLPNSDATFEFEFAADDAIPVRPSGERL